MTREEAINIMKVIVHMLEEKYDTDRVEDAVEMAIQALEQEPCEDAISRQAVEDAIYEYSRSCDVNYAQIMEYIDKLPPVNPQPKTGHWIRVTDKAGHLVWECDKCGWQQRFNTNFCPDCGAKMS